MKNETCAEKSIVRGTGKEGSPSCHSFFSHQSGSQAGVALVMVLLVVSLASFIVIELTHSSTLEARSNLIAERNLRGEYLMKSAVNFGRALISVGTLPGTTKPLWVRFCGCEHSDDPNSEIPLSLLGVQEPGARLFMIIVPANTKLPLQQLVASSGSDPVNGDIRDALVRLFEQLNFDGDDERDPDFNDEFFDSRQLVANLIDYMDRDDTSYTDSNFPIGVEDRMPENAFPKEGGLSSIDELGSIPGFTSARINQLRRYTYTVPTSAAFVQRRVDINFSSARVLSTLDPAVDEFKVQGLISYRTANEPLTEANRINVLKNEVAIDSSVFFNLTSARATLMQILVKVQFGDIRSFMNVYVQIDSGGGGGGGYPKIVHREIY